MAATLMQLRRLVRSRLGVPMSDDFFGDQVLDDNINLAIQTIDAEYRWPWSEVVDLVTVDSEAPDILTDVTWRTTRVVMIGSEELTSVAPADLLRYENAVGQPTVWCPVGNVIALRPRVQGPTDVVHYWYRQPTWLRDDADNPEMPDQFAGAIVAKASELLAARESSGGDATRHAVEYGAWITRMRRDVRSSTGPTRTRVRPGSWI